MEAPPSGRTDAAFEQTALRMDNMTEVREHITRITLIHHCSALLWHNKRILEKTLTSKWKNLSVSEKISPFHFGGGESISTYIGGFWWLINGSLNFNLGVVFSCRPFNLNSNMSGRFPDLITHIRLLRGVLLWSMMQVSLQPLIKEG